MKRRVSFLLLIVVALMITGITTDGFCQTKDNLKMIFIQADSPSKVKKLAAMGMDIAREKKTSLVERAEGLKTQGYRVEVVASGNDLIKLDAAGFQWSYVTMAKARQMKAAAAAVYHSFDEPVLGVKDQLKAVEKKYPKDRQAAYNRLQHPGPTHVGHGSDQKAGSFPKSMPEEARGPDHRYPPCP